MAKKNNRFSENSTGIQRKKGLKKNYFGKLLMLLQLGVSGVFIYIVYSLGMLPLKMFTCGAAFLFFLWTVIFYSQMAPARRGIGGKILSLLLIAGMSLGSLRIVQANDMLGKMTSPHESKVNKMVVAVLKDDPAQVLEDAADYTFGVQYMKGADNVNGTVNDIEKQLGQDIELHVYESLATQAQGLLDGEVKAIIYNQSFEDVLEQAVPGFKSKIRILHEYKIKLQLNGKSSVPEGKPIDGVFSVYISGIDVFGDVSESSRSDVNIIAVVNPETHQILLVTTPRDYYVPIPGVSGGQRDKLTHAGLYGIDTSMATLGELYNTDIDYYIRLNFTSMIDIINTLGGVDVYSPISFTTSEDSGYVMDVTEGYNTFDGEQALAFSRERQNLPDGDFGRGRNQQAVIEAMLKKMLSPTMLLKAGSIMNTIGNEVETNVPRDNINGFVKEQLDTNPDWKIRSIVAEGEPTEGICFSSGPTPLSVVEPDEVSLANIVHLADLVESGQQLPEAKSAAGSSDAGKK